MSTCGVDQQNKSDITPVSLHGGIRMLRSVSDPSRGFKYLKYQSTKHTHLLMETCKTWCVKVELTDVLKTIQHVPQYLELPKCHTTDWLLKPSSQSPRLINHDRHVIVVIRLSYCPVLFVLLSCRNVSSGPSKRRYTLALPAVMIWARTTR